MRLAVATTAVALAVGSVLLAAPVEALRIDGQEPVARGGLNCAIGVVGFDSGRHIRSDSFTNGALEESRTTSEALPFDATAFGYLDSSGTAKRNTLRLNVIAADGVPRNVALKRTPGWRRSPRPRSTSRAPSRRGCTPTAGPSTRTRSTARA
jgi:hypothetical protein